MLPSVILHNAVSLDGKIDGFPIDLQQYYDLSPAGGCQRPSPTQMRAKQLKGDVVWLRYKVKSTADPQIMGLAGFEPAATRL